MANTPKKPTKKANYSTILSIIETCEQEGIALSAGDITYDTLREFIEHEVELLDNKAAAAQKRAADKKTQGDELRERVYNTLSDTEFMTVDQIVEAIGDPDVTRNMVTSRLTQLIDKDNPETSRVERGSATVEPTTEGGKSRKVSAYKRIG